jgi:transcription-repair coupling factor (superfamily II helicase)
MIIDPFESRFEAVLERFSLQSRAAAIQVTGCASPVALTLLLTQATAPFFSKSSHLIIVPSEDDVERLCKNARFWDPDRELITCSTFDVSPYSNLYPNPVAVSARLRFLHRAQHAQPGEMFVASIEALLQKTLPPAVLAAKTMHFRVGGIVPESFANILSDLGYQSSPVVEDAGHFSFRGGLIDIFSPAHELPVRIELFGDAIESMRFFDPGTQRSQRETQSFTLIPPREIFFTDETRERVATQYRAASSQRQVDASERDQILHSIVHGQLFPGVDFLLPYFYPQLAQPLEFFKSHLHIWHLDQIEIQRDADLLWGQLKKDFAEASHLPIFLEPEQLYLRPDELVMPPHARTFLLSRLEILETSNLPNDHLEYQVRPLSFLQKNAQTEQDLSARALHTLRELKSEGTTAFISAHTDVQAQRLKAVLERAEYDVQICGENETLWAQWIEAQHQQPNLIHIVPRGTSESLRIPEEQMVFLREEDFFGRKIHRREYKTSGSLETRTNTLSFGDLKTGDAVVHVQHGVGIFEGLKVMQIQGVDAEFIQIRYKDDDRLYLPIYRVGQIQKYSGASDARILDKLGGTTWAKTTIKVKNQLRDIANDLLQLYAQRAQATRPPFSEPGDEFAKFEGLFPYDETEDQLKAVRDVIGDMVQAKPMDRLICGDVGFGKTEIAMRAAFEAVSDQRQVVVLAPTTVLTFQHLETFRRRFKNWPLEIRALNRFVAKVDQKKTIDDLRSGRVDIVIGTHRLLGKDIEVPNLGLLIIDEEQKFGVTHKEKIRKLKASVDTLTLSATPIPRTLNMSLMGLRDLSIINTAPSDRLPTRTFVTKFDEETIRKAVAAELSRGGQLFFIHNRVQSIYGIADRLREFLPDVRMRVAHGQMEEHELEKAMLAFFNHEIDMLVCTTIVESGMDIPRANTMFIDDAHTFGLSQLYQLRGRVGRSKERAYCYLLIPPHRAIDPVAQERLRVIQENTALGSGIRIAQYDLELRGAGNMLGEDQSGHINAVGYELYIELLEEAFKEAKGEELVQQIEPEINVRIAALIPSDYISDIRIRLSYYKALSQIEGPSDLDSIEADLRDQFGKPPEAVMNLMGLMLIRRYCKDLGIRDLSSGTKTVSLAFTQATPLSPDKVVRLATQDNKKFSITPDSRLIIRMNNITWPNIFDELTQLKKLVV